MKKRGRISVLLFVCLIAATVLIITVAAMVSGGRTERRRELEQIRREVERQIKSNMERAVKEGNFSHYLEPHEVSFAVKEVYREDVLRYAVKIVFTIKTDKKLDDAQRRETAKDMEKLCEGFKTVQGKYVTVYPQRGKRGMVFVINGQVFGGKRITNYGRPPKGLKVRNEKNFRGGEEKKRAADKQRQVRIKKRQCIRVIFL